MSVRELKALLESCNQDAQVTILVPDHKVGFDICYGIKEAKQKKVNAAMEVYDDPWYVDVVQIKVQ